MKWLMRIMSKTNKKKRGFTLIELMVVVIVVGILAAAAVPIYRFALSRAYSSEGKATMGTIRTAELVWVQEDPDENYLTGAGATILPLLGVEIDKNSWWKQEGDFQVNLGSAITISAGATTAWGTGWSEKTGNTWVYAKGSAPDAILNIELALNCDDGTFLSYYP